MTNANELRDLRALLAHNIVRFTYRKVDGTIRHALGTRNLALAESHIGMSIPTPKGETNPYSYFDLDKMAWRSYKPENLIRVDEVIPTAKTTKSDIAVLAELREKLERDAELDKLREKLEEDVELTTHTDNSHMTDIFKGLFGGVGFGGDTQPHRGFPYGGGGVETPITKRGELPKRNEVVGTPTFTDKGVALPINSVSVEDFAKMVAKYVVVEIVNRLNQ